MTRRTLFRDMMEPAPASMAAAVLVRVMLFLLVAFAVLLLTGHRVQAQTYHHILRVVDGDTVHIATSGTAVAVRVRLRDIDTPELNGRCWEERNKANQAKAALEQLVAGGVRVESDLSADQYGRVLARLFNRSGQDVGEELIRQGLAHRYDGRGPRPGWCPDAARR